MRRTQLVVILGIIAGIAGRAAANPLALPVLGWNLEIESPPVWAASHAVDEHQRDIDRLEARETGAVLTLIRIGNGCAEHDEATANGRRTEASLGQLVIARPPWVPPTWKVEVLRFANAAQLCRVLGDGSGLLVRVFDDGGVDLAEPRPGLPEAFFAIEQLVANPGFRPVAAPPAPTAPTGPPPPGTFGRFDPGRILDNQRGRTAPYPAAATFTPITYDSQGGDPYLDHVAMRHRFDGGRLSLELGGAWLTETSGVRGALTLALPPRRSNPTNDIGFAYSLDLTLGVVNNGVVGDGRLGMGVAFGNARTLVALEGVVGLDAIPWDYQGSSFAEGGTDVYGGGAVIVRVPIDDESAFESSASIAQRTDLITEVRLDAGWLGHPFGDRVVRIAGLFQNMNNQFSLAAAVGIGL
jgi:hypothetical protein